MRSTYYPGVCTKPSTVLTKQAPLCIACVMCSVLIWFCLSCGICSCCGSNIIGCYAPNGEHCERPLEVSSEFHFKSGNGSFGTHGNRKTVTVKSLVLIIRGTYYQGWFMYMRYSQGQNEEYLLPRSMH